MKATHRCRRPRPTSSRCTALVAEDQPEADPFQARQVGEFVIGGSDRQVDVDHWFRQQASDRGRTDMVDRQHEFCERVLKHMPQDSVLVCPTVSVFLKRTWLDLPMGDPVGLTDGVG